MTSAINPNNINGAYPVAGQDNNSQGFRDNFTNTKTNFQYAADEITALQNSVVLSANLANSAPVINDLLTSTLSNGFLQDMYYTRVALGTPVTTISVDYAAGSYQTVTTNGAMTVAFSNFPAAGAAATVTLQITVASSTDTVALPAAVSVNTAGIQGLNTTTNIITFAAVGVYAFTFTTSDNGSTITVDEVNKQLQPFNNSQEDLVASAAASLATTVSYFSTAAAETATLAAGAEGQIKTFAMYADTGDMVITVTNAGWKSSGTGTITFDTIGDACTLQYINSKWFCIGNNGCVFA
jgi:hypothetical protein